MNDRQTAMCDSLVNISNQRVYTTAVYTK